MVEEESDPDQFESGSPAVNASGFIDEHFIAEGAEDGPTTGEPATAPRRLETSPKN